MVDKSINCGDCEYWKKIDDYEVAPMFEGYKLCIRHSHDRSFDISKVNATAVCLSEGIEGEFITKSSFGCIEGKRK